MFINKLQVENLRNLASLDLEPHCRFNVISGNNGAGKTSILESLVILSRGRSFRTTHLEELPGPNGPEFRVFARLSEGGRESRLGLQRDGKKWRARLNGKDIQQISQLTTRLPLVLLEPESHRLVSGPPDVRRKFLDWCMFHVEHRYLECYRRYARLLKQRNAALRRKQLDVIESIDPLLCESAELIDVFRRDLTNQLIPEVHVLLRILSPELPDIQFSYQKGWSGDSLEECLAVTLDKDLDRGSTNDGPHRADLVIKTNATPVRQLLSRGEQKVLASSLTLSQERFISKTERRALVLLDDLGSELDKDHFNKVIEYVAARENQVWLTGVDTPDLDVEKKMFHVEHGVASEVV